MLDTIIFIETAKSNQAQIAAQNSQIHNMSTQLKVHNHFIRELIAVTETSLDKNYAPIEVEGYGEILSCFINIMKPKLESTDVV